MIRKVKRGEIYLVNFDPTVGAEIKKTRPALILQNDIANEYSPITIVAAITSKFGTKLYPTEVKINLLNKKSVVLLNQVRSIDKKRLVKKLGKVNAREIAKINKALLISFGLTNLL